MNWSLFAEDTKSPIKLRLGSCYAFQAIFLTRLSSLSRTLTLPHSLSPEFPLCFPLSAYFADSTFCESLDWNKALLQPHLHDIYLWRFLSFIWNRSQKKISSLNIGQHVKAASQIRACVLWSLHLKTEHVRTDWIVWIEEHNLCICYSPQYHLLNSSTYSHGNARFTKSTWSPSTQL